MARYIDINVISGNKNIVINGGSEKQFLSKTTKIIDNTNIIRDDDIINNNITNKSIYNKKYVVNNYRIKNKKLKKSNNLLKYINNSSQKSLDYG